MCIEKKTESFNSGELKNIFRNIYCNHFIGLTASGKHAWQEEEEARKDSSTVLIFLEQLFFPSSSGTFKTQSFDLSLHDNEIIQSNFFQYIYHVDFFHVGCAINLHSIINSGLIFGGQSLRNKQTVFFLPIDLMDKSHKDPDEIDFNVPRHAQYMQYMRKAWKRHQDAAYWVDMNLAIRKGLRFYQIRSNAITLQGILPAYCIPKVVRLKTGEVLYEKTYMSPRLPPKISLKH